MPKKWSSCRRQPMPTGRHLFDAHIRQGWHMFISLLENRRSIRKYRTRAVEPETIDRLIEGALRSPSSRGFKPWAFVVVTEPDLLERLSRAKPHGASFIKNAPLGIVVCADPERSDVWIEDASIASVFIHLTATSLGLGSCWIQIRERMHSDEQTAQDYVRDLLGIPEPLCIEAIIAVGYPAEEKPPRGSDTLLHDRIHHNRFGRNYPSGP